VQEAIRAANRWTGKRLSKGTTTKGNRQMANDLSKAKLKTLGTNESPPDGYVCLGEKWPAEGTAGRDRERVRKGIVTGDVDAYRHVRFEGDNRGNIYVCLADAVAWLAAFDARAAKSSSIAEHHLPVTDGMDKRYAEGACESLSSIDSTMDEIYRVLERLTTAVESIATQPRTAQHELMGTMSSNGFHN
jgi:hypothetical protein